MKKNTCTIIISLLIITLVHSCASIKPVAQPANKPLPALFANKQDALSAAGMNWKAYFTDKTLISLIDSALINNWDLLMAIQRTAVAQSEIQMSRAALQPTVHAAVNAGINKYGEHTMDGAGNKGVDIDNGKTIPTVLPDYFVGLQTSWEIDVWGKLRNRKKATMLRFLSSQEGRNLVVTHLVAEMAAAYYEILANEQTLAVITETITVQERALDIVKVQKSAAAANELAVKQFEAQLLHVKGMRYEIMQQIAQAENKINFLTGSYAQRIERDTLAFTNAFPQMAETGIPAALLQNRPDIKQAVFDLMAAKADVQAAKAAFYPSLTIYGSIGLQAYQPGLLFTTPASLVYGLLGNLSAPLINRSAIKASFNSANARQLEALYNYHKTIANAYFEVQNEISRIKNLQQMYELKNAETNSLLQGIDIAATLFRTGRASYLEVLITQQNALQSRLELVNTKKNQLFAAINIYKALGGGWR